MASQTVPITSLPGPVRFIERVGADIDSGQSAVVVFPESAIQSGLADQILDEIGNCTGAQLVDPTRQGLATAIVESSGYAHEWRPGHDPLYDLVNWPHLEGMTCTIRSWHHDLRNALGRWESLQHAAGRDPHLRFRLLVGASDSVIAKAGLSEVESVLHLSLHWWWGIIDRIDTELYLQREPRFVYLPTLTHSQRLELVAWDLETSALVPQTAEEFRHFTLEDWPEPDPIWRKSRLGEELERRPRIDRRHRTSPQADLRQLWNAGVLELWDGRLRPRLHRESSTREVHRLIWQAQVRVLFPYLEEHRQELEVEHFRRTNREVASAVGDDDLIELGTMFHLWINGKVRLDKAVSRRLEAARKVRNNLAHGEPARDRDVGILLRHLPF